MMVRRADPTSVDSADRHVRAERTILGFPAVCDWPQHNPPETARMIRKAATLSVLIACAGQAVAWADLPSIRFDRLSPLGAAAGTTVEVEVAGAEVEGVDTLLLDHPGLSAKPIAGSTKTGGGGAF